MDYSSLLNDKQLEAVRCTEGPLLIIAGAGSGKTRVLTYRIAYLIEERKVNPWNIMAITFTNKAAGEMRDRVNDIAGEGEQVWVSTFHSACARIMRGYAERLGYTSGFSIYDTDDSKRIIKDIVSELNLDPKRNPPKHFQYKISYAKNHMAGVDDMYKDASNRIEETEALIYEKYEERLFKNNAMDFDDLLIKTVEMFKKNPDVLERYQQRLRYIMVDEYQDTNRIQFELVSLLAKKYRNLCVVGDDDQSIYKFRGADIRNILDFERVFKDAKVVKLEQNYRSAGNILKGANGVIRNNTEHKEKTLWTAKEDGELITSTFYSSGLDEAREVVRDISRRSAISGLNAFAVLYRTNAQSRLFEEQLVREGIPYRLVGGVNFYSRKEIKDVLAYLKAIENGRDELSVRRIINIPRRGIGDKSLDKISQYAAVNNLTFFDTLSRASEIPGLGRTGQKAEDFSLFIRKYRAIASDIRVEKLIRNIIDEIGYIEELRSEGTDEALDRIRNIDELISKAADYDDTAENPSLSGFLQEISLVADIDSFDENAQKVVLMTLHGSKGLEFDNVYIVGMEEEVFPGFRTIYDEDDGELQEERRLFYVGMTRAKKTLKLSGARQRFVRGEQEFHNPSRFIGEIPEELLRQMNVSGSRYGFQTRQRSKPPEIPYKTALNPPQFKAVKSDSLEYAVGDKVKHAKFGVGTVLDIKDGGRDYEISVDFESFGVKKMFAAFARLERC